MEELNGAGCETIKGSPTQHVYGWIAVEGDQKAMIV